MVGFRRKKEKISIKAERRKRRRKKVMGKVRKEGKRCSRKKSHSDAFQLITTPFVESNSKEVLH